MRAPVTLLAATAALALLAGCGRPSGGGSSESAAAPPPSGPTPAQAAEMEASLPAPFNSGDLAHGQQVFNQCRACHTAEQGAGDMVGPNLWGVFGRKAGSEPGFNYSDGLKASGIVWDAPHIDKWITNPRAVVPDTRMSFLGLSNPKDRIDVIAYLKTITAPPPAS